MNTLPFIAAFGALAWLAIFLLTGTDQRELLFFAVICVIAWAIPMTWFAIKDDQELLSGDE